MSGINLGQSRSFLSEDVEERVQWWGHRAPALPPGHPLCHAPAEERNEQSVTKQRVAHWSIGRAEQDDAMPRSKEFLLEQIARAQRFAAAIAYRTCHGYPRHTSAMRSSEGSLKGWLAFTTLLLLTSWFTRCA
jgi:hypothetical protein